MSSSDTLTWANSPADDSLECDEDDTWFETAVLYNDEICNNCFRQVYHVEEDWWPKTIRFGLEKHLEKPRKVPVEKNTETVHLASRLAARSGGTRSCVHCGSVDFASYNRPLDKGDYMELAMRLSDLLADYDVAHDEDALLDKARDLKEDGDLRDSDDVFFDRATTVAVEEYE